jgi:hypothetical protein
VEFVNRVQRRQLVRTVRRELRHRLACNCDLVVDQPDAGGNVATHHRPRCRSGRSWIMWPPQPFEDDDGPCDIWLTLPPGLEVDDGSA